MKPVHMMLVMCLLSVTACSKTDAGGGSSAETVTAAECREMMEKGMELQGIPVDAVGELLEASVKRCVDSGAVSKSDYRCVMQATSESESRACKVDI